MENLWLWLCSIVLYWVVYEMLIRGAKPFDWSMAKSLGVIAFLTLPFNINGNVFTVFGNAVGEKDVFSVASFYQKANGTTITLIAPLTYQDAGDAAVSGVGVPSFQKGAKVGLIVGVAPYQHANRGNSIIFFGLAGQQVSLLQSGVVLGFAGDQRAGITAQTFIGLAFHQQVGEKERWFATIMPLKADEK